MLPYVDTKILQNIWIVPAKTHYSQLRMSMPITYFIADVNKDNGFVSSLLAYLHIFGTISRQST